jgi:hypothetical protein
MWRVAIYAREAPGRGGRVQLDRRISRLAVEVARRPGWRHVATYADLSLGRCQTRPGLCRLLVEATTWIDVVVVDGPAQISAARRERAGILDQLAASGATIVVVPSSTGRRLAKLVANVALADMIGEAMG